MTLDPGRKALQETREIDRSAWIVHELGRGMTDSYAGRLVDGENFFNKWRSRFRGANPKYLWSMPPRKRYQRSAFRRTQCAEDDLDRYFKFHIRAHRPNDAALAHAAIAMGLCIGGATSGRGMDNKSNDLAAVPLHLMLVQWLLVVYRKDRSPLHVIRVFRGDGDELERFVRVHSS